MKNVVLICIALFSVLGVVSIVQGGETGLTSAWLFEEGSGKTVKDLLGGNDGEIKGSVERTADGKFGRGLKFPGKGDSYVSVPYNDVFDSEPSLSPGLSWMRQAGSISRGKMAWFGPNRTRRDTLIFGYIKPVM